MKKLLLALALALGTSSAWAQNPMCPTRPLGDDSNACASTAFVQNSFDAGPFQRVFNVKNAPYNAVCDGVTNDTVAIQAAIDAAALVHGIVYTPAGTCIAAVQAEDIEGIGFLGDGDEASIWISPVNSTTLDIFSNVASGNVSNFFIQGMQFQASGANGIGLRIWNALWFSVTNVKVTSGGTAAGKGGVVIGGSGGGTFTNLQTYGYPSLSIEGDGASLTSSGPLTFNSSWFVAAGTATAPAILIKGNTNSTTFQNCFYSASGASATQEASIILDGPSSGVLPQTGSVSFINCHGESNYNSTDTGADFLIGSPNKFGHVEIIGGHGFGHGNGTRHQRDYVRIVASNSVSVLGVQAAKQAAVNGYSRSMIRLETTFPGAGDIYDFRSLLYSGSGSMYSDANSILTGTINATNRDQRVANLLLPSTGDILFGAAGGPAIISGAATGPIAFSGASVGGYTFDFHVYPETHDTAALGRPTIAWSDLFLASGGVINWANGTYTLTQSGSSLAFSGGVTLGTPLAIADGGTDGTTIPTARANLKIDSRTTFSNAAYVALATDYLIAQIGTLTAPRIVTLPLANSVNPGRSLIIIDESGTATTTNTISFARSGSDTINGSASTQVGINAAFGYVEFVSDGTSKWTSNRMSLGSPLDVGGILPPPNGGTGIANNAASTIAISGNFATTFTVTGTTGVTLPTSGTLATLGANTFTRLQTITQGTADEGILASTGYSVTGSGTTTMVDLAGTWNTSGAVTAIKLNITNTAAAIGSYLLDLQVGAATQFRVRKDGFAAMAIVGADTYATRAGNTIFSIATLDGVANSLSLAGNLGLGSANAVISSPSSLLVELTNSAGTAFAALSLTKVRGQGTAPAVTVCGTTPTISGTDLAGLVTTGTGTPTSCTITFNVAYAAEPYCVVHGKTQAQVTAYTVSASALVVTTTATDNVPIIYNCIARSGGWLLERDLPGRPANDNRPAFMDREAA